MGELIQLADRRPHLLIMGISGGQHIIQLQEFLDLINGKKKFADLTAGEDILPVILNEWIDTLIGCDQEF